MPQGGPDDAEFFALITDRTHWTREQIGKHSRRWLWAIVMHPRDLDKTSAITGRAPIKISTKGSAGLSPRQEFWRHKQQAGWPEWMIASKWEEMEEAKKAAQATRQKAPAQKKRK